MNKLRYIIATLLIFILTMSLFSFTASAADLTTKYRVYQNDQLLGEFATSQQAISFARQYGSSYVEEIETRKWIYSDFPRYQVSQLNIYIGTYRTLNEAIQEARKWANASVRDIQTQGWVWNNYNANLPIYQLYQGEVSLDNWTFKDLASAQLEAKRWANAHIIDLRTNEWVWDNMTSAKKQEFRERKAVYQVYQINYTEEEWKYAFLEDAINEALKWENSYIVNTTKNNQKVFSNESKYLVYQYNRFLKGYINLEEAIQYAMRWDHSRILTTTNREIWNNYPFFRVHTEQSKALEFKTLSEALSVALTLPKAWIKNYNNQMIWDNSTRLQYWAWTGSATDQTIRNQVADTVGLDVISPTWFKLLDANGNVEDTTNANTVKWLKDQGLEIHPLVHNQFNSTLTTQFLSNAAAQKKFIETIVNRSAGLGLHGINLDFESLRGSDRAAFTKFVKDLTAAAHLKGLKLSIDLPRGSLAWNHLTAFDHIELAKIVDHVITMTYDHHYSGSPTPGSVAGLQWVEQGVVEFLSYGIPRDKLIMGIPFYIREWKLDTTGKLISNRAITSRNIKAIIATKNLISTWDSRFNQYRMEYKEDGFTYVFWLEDQHSIKSRLDVAKKFNLAGIAAWRLGQEDPDFWKAMVLEK